MEEFGEGLPDLGIGAIISSAANQMRAAFEDMTAERYQYQRVPWEQVNELARQGWLLLPMPVVVSLIGAEPLFVMSRKLGPADDAAHLLEEASRHVHPPEMACNVMCPAHPNTVKRGSQ